MNRDLRSMPDDPPSPQGRRRLLPWIWVLILALIGLVLSLSYYVDALWFDSLGYASVFWTRFDLQSLTFIVFAVLTFAVLYGVIRALQPARLAALIGNTVYINRQPVQMPLQALLGLVALGLPLLVAVLVGNSMMGRWTSFALYAHAPAGGASDPIFGQPLSFYLFALPVWQLIAGWWLTLALMACALTALLLVLTRGADPRGRRPSVPEQARLWRVLALSLAAVLLALAAHVYLGRYDRLYQEGTIFSGVTYTDAHVTLVGLLGVCAALVAGALIALLCAGAVLSRRWLLVSALPAVVVYLLVSLAGGYVSSFIVKPNQLVRERPFIAHNIEMTRRAYALDRIEPHPFPAESSVESVDPQHNQPTLDNIRLWDWRALQDTLRQIQEIRTYYDFPDIDIDRYQVEGTAREMMLATRELNIDKLPESSRNWINEKLIYTHGYGITMNPVNGFTPEGLPSLVLSNMPVQGTLKGIQVTRPEIYFGELTNTDVYVKTRQQEFDYPQGDTNNLTTYQGTAGIRLGGFLRRTLIALDRGDIAKLPFSDDVTPDSRLLMRRNLRERVAALAPFLTLDPDPYVVVGRDGRIYWFMDAFTTADSYPDARGFELGDESINYIRNSVKIIIDAYTGATTFYVFDRQDPVIAAYRAVFPALFVDAAAMPPDLRQHVRYPELLLSVQAAIYGLYHMTDPDVFYNREDLWSVAPQMSPANQPQQVSEPNFVLMTLPGEHATEFIEILPFTPANRNNLIAWIAGRSDGEHYGQAVVYDFPKTRLVDGPLQIEARIDQNAQLSGQLSLWNQQGSHVRRGSLIVIPIGHALLYAEPIYLQADRSPMPELRLVVLAVQDRLAYGPTFETAMAALFGGAASTLSASPQANATAASGSPVATAADSTATPTSSREALIAAAARDLADYQQLTAAGKLGEAGQKLEALKHMLEALQARP